MWCWVGASSERTRQIDPGEEYAGSAWEEMFSVLSKGPVGSRKEWKYQRKSRAWHRPGVARLGQGTECRTWTRSGDLERLQEGRTR